MPASSNGSTSVSGGLMARSLWHAPVSFKVSDMTFRCPVHDQRLVLDHVVRIAELSNDLDMVDAVLEGAAQFAEGEFAPLDRIGDTQGSRMIDGKVVTPDGFKAAYQAFVEGGWMSLAAPEQWGGQGLPLALSAALMEDLNAANIGFALCPMLSMGAIEALQHHGSDELKERYLAKVVSGEWPATMNLTEPQAGSDVGALKTRAEPNGDGSWRVSGTKIYITYGDHDLAEQIVHLVLARTPGAPEGTRGISLFLVPKILPDGSANDLNCVSIEHKLGIHASPTCVMSYGDGGGATGWMIGAENQGMRAMFTMMNNARLNVGLQGVGIAERATQRAVAYALERRQLRATGHRRPSRCPPHAAADAQPDDGEPRAGLLRLRPDRPRGAWRRGGRLSRRCADPARQGLGHRRRLRSRQPRRPGPWRDGLYRGDRRRPASPRRAHRPDLRRHQRHPGRRSGRAQARA